MPTDFTNEFPANGGFPSGFPSGSGSTGGGNIDFSSGSGSGGGNGFFGNPTNIMGLVNAAIGIYGGFRQAGAANDAREEIAKRFEQAQQLASADNFAGLVARLQPMFRELVASGLGPKFQSDVATMLAKRGLTGTGTGDALSIAAKGAPGIFAMQNAFSEAGRLQEGQVGAALGVPIPGAKMDPFTNALVTGARAFFGTTAGQSQQQPQRPEEQDLFPNLSARR